MTVLTSVLVDMNRVGRGMGAPTLAVVPGDGRIKGLSKRKAGPAEVPLNAGNVPARGHS